jgi:cyanate permease
MVAVLTLLLLWPLAGAYLRPTPASLGVAPDGGAVAVGMAAAPTVDRSPASRRDLLRDRRFLTMSAAFALGLFSQVGLIAHLLSLLVPILGERAAAGAVSLTTACAVIGRLLLGAVIDRLDRRAAAAGNFALQACGFLLIAGGGAEAALVGCVLFGLGLGNLVSLPPLIVDREFDAVDAGRVVALTIAINQATFSFAPGVFGALHDFFGSYAAPLALAIALHTMAAVLVLAGRRR